MALLTREEVLSSLSRFKKMRDALLHEDVSELEHHLKRFVDFCDSDRFVSRVLDNAVASSHLGSDHWWGQSAEVDRRDRGPELLDFPDDLNDELALRFLIMKDVATKKRDIWGFATLIGVYKLPAAKERFISLVVRPFCEELSERLGEAAHIASPEVRALQATPPDRIPADNESRIFLSHKSTDKPLVRRYYKALTEIGFRPWMDETEMPAGTKLERGLLRGFEESCAAVFFITERFIDEQYLATEVDYAVAQKRAKGNRFAIITLCFGKDIKIPGLLKPFIYKNVANDLDGFYELVRALPIELGPTRWKEGII